MTDDEVREWMEEQKEFTEQNGVPRAYNSLRETSVMVWIVEKLLNSEQK